MQHKTLLLLAFSLGLRTVVLQAQSILYGYPNIGGGNGAIVSINLVTCEETLIATVTQSGNFTDFVMMPNGNIYLQSGVGGSSAVALLDPSSGTWTIQTILPGIPQNGSMMALTDSTILISNLGNFFSYNINTNVATSLGGIPGFSGFGEMFEYNGEIYITQSGGGNYPNGTYILNLSPLGLTPVSLPGYIVFPLTSVCNQIISPESISEYNIETGVINLLCGLSYSNSFGSTAPNPLAATGPLCDCTTDAGTWSDTQIRNLSVCGEGDVVLDHEGNEVLDGNDNLVFVLVEGYIFDDFPNNVLAVFDEPTISFIPGIMQPNTLYYVYPVAADALGNSIDFNDPCRYLSWAPVTIEWVSAPAVDFSLFSEDCSTGCQTISANFTGQAPFALTYSVATSNGVTGTFTQTYSSNVASISVCPPAGYTGPLTVQALSVSNSACICD